MPTAIARGGGFDGWHDLEESLRGGAAAMDEQNYRQRLVAALPEPCRPLLLGSFEADAPPKSPPPDGGSEEWLRFVFPYVMACSVLHRGRSDILRTGSGKGQRLRERLVLGVLVGDYGRQKRVPRLDPETLEILVEGSVAELFAQDARHPDFAVEFERLKDHRILRYADGALRILPPAESRDLAEHVSAKRASRAEYFIHEVGGDDAMEALGLALAGIGIADAWRVAEAVVMQGSPDYVTPSGPTLELLTNLASEGKIEALAKACRVFGVVHPANIRYLRDWIPGKILDRYMIGREGLNATRFVSWASSNKEWPDRLRGSLDEPIAFVRTVDTIIAEVRAA